MLISISSSVTAIAFWRFQWALRCLETILRQCIELTQTYSIASAPHRCLRRKHVLGNPQATGTCTDSPPDKPYLRADRYTPNGTSTNSRSLSPLSPKSPRQPSFMMPARSATAPLPLQPPSPELISQDCAFPPFPTAIPSTATLTAPTSPVDTNNAHSPTPQTLAHIAYFTAPLSPRNNGSRSVLQRMNTIAPGPFNVRATKGSGITDENKALALNLNHESFAKPASSDRSGAFDHAPHVGGEGYIQRPSTAGTETSRKLSLSSISGGPRSLLDRRPPTTHSVPSGATAPRPARPDGDAEQHAPPVPNFKENPAEPLREEHHAHKFPIQPSNETPGDGLSAPLPRKPSASAPRTRRPTVSAANRPLDEIGSVSSYKSSKNPPSPPQLRTRGTDLEVSRPNQGWNNPASGPTRAGDFEGGNPYHTSTESTSSNGSQRSDMKSGSSRSSPPLSDESFNLRRRPSDRMTRLDDLLHGVQESTEQVAEKEKRKPAPRVAPLSFSRPLYTRPLEQPPGMEALLSPPESPMDPAIQNGVLSPIPHLSNHPPVPPVPELPAQIPTQRPRPPARRATSGNKGNCRGCGEVIKGKSVSSADGRLSGRYHKQCFVCETCNEPFQTADFYVLNNYPYCERHYHQLNGSLCEACDGGIEGQYLETELKLKFHPGCFVCQVSRHWGDGGGDGVGDGKSGGMLALTLTIGMPQSSLRRLL